MIARKRDKDTPKKRVQVLQRKLYLSAKANPRRSYGILYDKVCWEATLREAWRRVSRKGGSAGVDGKSIKWIREFGVGKYLEELRQALVEKRYRPDKIRRAYIPKSDDRKRPLGVPTVTDRVVQMAVKLIIEPLFEADFLESSKAFRPERSALEAIREVEKHLRRGCAWVVDVDLKNYYDTIPHEDLMRKVQHRVRDPRVLRLIRWWLKAGVLEDGKVTYPDLGVCQGGVLSPLLSNIYLHELDKEYQDRGTWVSYIRYADDILILTLIESDARREHKRLREKLRKMGLALNEEKTRVVPVREGFEFLGFSFRCGKYHRNGKPREIMIKAPRTEAITKMLKRIKEVAKEIPLGKPVTEAVKAINRCLAGWANYFRCRNLWLALKRLVSHAGRQLRLFLRRRYHRKRIQGGKRWPDSFFHEQLGLYTVAELYRGR